MIEHESGALAGELARMTRLQTLSVQLAQANGDDLLNDILAAAAELTGTDKGNIQFLDPATGKLRIVAHQGLGNRLVEHFAEHGWAASCDAAMEQVQRIIVEDVAKAPGVAGTVELEIVLEDGIRAIQSTPLISRDGRFLGMLNNHYRHVHRPSDSDLRYLDLLARMAADLIERKQSEEMLHESEARFRTLSDGAPALIWVNGVDGCEYVNRGYLDFLSVQMDDVRGYDWSQFIHPDDRAGYLDAYVQSMTTRTVFDAEFRFRRHDGEYRWMKSVGQPRLGSGGEFFGYSGVSIDITERKQAEEARRESQERQAFLLKFSDALRPLEDAVAIQQTASELLGEHLAVARAGYGEMEPDGEVIVVSRDWRRSGVPTVAGRFRIDDFGTFFTDQLRAGRVATIEDAANDPRVDADMYANTWSTIGVRSAIACPIFKQGRFVAALFVHHERPRRWRQSEISLVSDLAERTWEAVARARTEAALRESEEQYRALFESIDEGFCIVEMMFDEHGKAIDYLFVEANPIFEHQTGLAEPVGKTALQLVPGLEQWWVDTYGNVALTGESVRFQHGSGPMGRFFDVYASRVGDDRSRKVAIVFSDITERKQAVETLRESEQRFRNMADNAPVMVWVTERDGSCSFLSKSWYDFTGQTPHTGLGFGWLDATHPDDRSSASATFLAANAKHEAFRFEYRLRRHDGEYFWAIDAAAPRFDEAGRFLGHIGSVMDITERRKAEDVQRMLTAELSHRVKNMLATVQAVASQTLRHNADPAQFVAKFGGRIQSMSRVHSLLSNTNWQAADLRELIGDQLLSGPIDETRVTAWGPSVALEPQLATQVAMIVHELGTNSIKYGALSEPKGIVTIGWTVSNDALNVQWTERGGPPVQAPIRRGFGTALIEQSARSVGGEANLAIEANGVQWNITLPLPSVRAPSVNAMGLSNQGYVDTTPRRDGSTSAGDPAPSILVGKQLLIVEDEPLVALDIAATLEQAGAEIAGSAGSAAEALALIESTRLDAALLDGNLGGTPVDAIAIALTRRNVPFAFVTGYGRDSLPEAFRSADVLPKPFSAQRLLETAAKLVRRPADVHQLRK